MIDSTEATTPAARRASPPEGRAPELRAYRPREKLRRVGATRLGFEELLTVLLGAGHPRATAAATAAKLASRFTLSQLAAFDVDALERLEGLGPASAARIKAAFELGRRAATADSRDERPLIDRPSSVYRHVRYLGAARKEHLVGLYLDTQNRLLHRETVSVGSLNTTRTHPREILHPAIEHLALGFILVHNHPSGCLDPSPEDVEFTLAVRRAGELMGIELYDHVIVARRGWVSLRERGVF